MYIYTGTNNLTKLFDVPKNAYSRIGDPGKADKVPLLLSFEDLFLDTRGILEEHFLDIRGRHSCLCLLSHRGPSKADK